MTMRIPAILLFPSLLFFLVGCGPNLPKHLGKVAADNVELASSPVLSYLQDALEGDTKLKVKDLFTDEFTFASAPDPSQLLADRLQEAREQATPDYARRLSVLNYNVGLLDRPKILGVIDRVRVPEIESRRQEAPEKILSRGYDIVLLQEVWETLDVTAFRDAAVRHDYSIYAGSDEWHTFHGLVILVKKSLIEGDSKRHEVLYEIQYSLEDFPGPGIRRGYLSWRFKTPDGLTVHLFNTHMTAFEEHWRVRMAQARELGLAVATVPRSEVVLLGGDVNASPYYHHDTWTWPDGTKVSQWWSNAISYALLLHYGDLRDMLAASSPAQDVELGSQVPTNHQRADEIPYGAPGYCDRVADQVFTATDCNSLHFRGYPGQSSPHRIDHLYFRPGERSIYVVSHDIVFDEKMTFEGAGTFELSDHYAVLADLRVSLE